MQNKPNIFPKFKFSSKNSDCCGWDVLSIIEKIDALLLLSIPKSSIVSWWRISNKFLPILVYPNTESRALNPITWINSSNSVFNIEGDKIHQLKIDLFIIFQQSFYFNIITKNKSPSRTWDCADIIRCRW